MYHFSQSAACLLSHSLLYFALSVDLSQIFLDAFSDFRYDHIFSNCILFHSLIYFREPCIKRIKCLSQLHLLNVFLLLELLAFLNKNLINIVFSMYWDCLNSLLSIYLTLALSLTRSNIYLFILSKSYFEEHYFTLLLFTI